MRTKKKHIPNDVVFLFACLTAVVVFSWGHSNSIHRVIDVYMFVIPVICMIGVPMLICVHSYYKHKKNIDGGKNES